MKQLGRIIAVLAVIALVVGGLWWKSSRHDDPPKKWVPISSGVYASGADASRLTARPTKAKLEKLALATLTKPYEVKAKGGDALSSPVTLRLPTTAKPGDVALLASKNPGKPWEYLGPKDGKVTIVTLKGKNYLQATVSHLSIKLGFSPVDWIKDQWNDALVKASGGLKADTSIPKCHDSATAGKLGYGLGVAQKGAITACVGYKNDAAELIVKNVKRYPLTVWHRDLRRTKGPASQLGVAALTKFDAADHTTLMAGDTVVLSKKLDYGKHAEVTTELNSWTRNLYRLDVAMHAVAQMYEAMRGKVPYGDIANLVLQGVDCTNAINKASVTDLVSACFSPQVMEKLTEKSGVPVDRAAAAGEFANGLSTWLMSEITSVWDVSRGDRAILWLNRHAPPAPKFKLPHSCGQNDYTGAVTILENSVTCAEALDVAAAYGRGAFQPRTITSKNCDVLAKKVCAITGSWKCTTVSEGETECAKGSALIHNGSPIAVSFRGTWHTHNVTITVTSATTGRIDWGEVGSYSATFAYSVSDDSGLARIKTSTMQKVAPNEYNAFKVGAYYNMKLDGYLLSMTNTSDPNDGIAGCGNGHQSDCGM